MKSRKTIIIVATVVVVIAAAVVIILTSLDRIVAAAIEQYGSMVTQTRVAVSYVRIKLSEGEGSVSGLIVGNPSGFSSLAVFQLGSISTKIDTGTVTRDMIIIDHVIITRPQVMYEVNKAGESNIDIIKKNVRHFQEQNASGKTGAQKKDKGKEVRILIRKLLIKDGNINVRIAAIDKTMTIPLPNIELSNVGGKDGTSPGEVGSQIVSALTRGTVSAASGLGIDKYVGRTLEEVGKGVVKGGDILKDTAKGAGNTIKSLFGK